MKKQTRRYTEEFKQEAIQFALKSSSVDQAAKSLGIPGATLHGWLNKLKQTSAVTNQSKASQPDFAALLEENRRLHKENNILKEEKEILKKAATYFAQHQK